MPNHANFIYRSARTRQGVASVAMVICAASQVVLVILDANGANVASDTSVSSEFAMAGVALALCASIAVAGVAFCMWFHAVVKNMRALGLPSSTTPKRAVWSLFIPFVNLWEPYKLLKEVREASDDGTGGLPRAQQIARLWWVMWIGASIVSRVTPNGDGVTGIDYLGAGMTWLAAILCTLMMRFMTNAQDDRAARLSHDDSLRSAVLHTPFVST